MSSHTPELFNIHPIRNAWDALAIGNIRNSGAEFMTHDVAIKNPNDQLEWYYDAYKAEHANGRLTAYLGTLGVREAAYGMIAQKDGDYWLTGVITPELRGKGLGRKLFEALGEEVADLGADRILLDVRRKNLAARSLYESLDYRYIAVDPDNDILVMQKEVPDAR